MGISSGESIRAGRVSFITHTPCCLSLTLAHPGGYHIGEGPDDRTMSTLEDHGITDYVHHARKVQPVSIRGCG
jgi:hypothetical protein